MITKHLMALLALTSLAIVLLYALLVISIRQERMSETLLKQSGDMQEILAQKLHETQCQVGGHQNGSGN